MQNARVAFVTSHDHRAVLGKVATKTLSMTRKDQSELLARREHPIKRMARIG